MHHCRVGNKALAGMYFRTKEFTLEGSISILASQSILSNGRLSKHKCSSGFNRKAAATAE